MSNALLELIAKRKQETGVRQKTIKPKAGRNRYRILPGWDANDPAFFHDFGQHFIKDSSGQVKAVYVCVDKTYGRPCDICSAVEAAIRATQDDATVNMLKEAKSGGRVLLNVLELDGPTPTEPQILEVAPSVFNGRKGVGGIVQLFDDYPTLLDPQNGFDIVITKTGTGKNDTAYSVIAVPGKPVPADALGKIANLATFVAQESEQQKIRALTTFSQVSGVLPSPSQYRPAAQVAPVDLGAGMTIDDDVPTPAAPAAPVAPVAQAPAAETAPAAPAKVATPSSGDAELDALLADLN